MKLLANVVFAAAVTAAFAPAAVAEEAKNAQAVDSKSAPQVESSVESKAEINLDKISDYRLSFLKKQIDNANKETLRYLLADINAWLTVNADRENADKALSFKADVQEKLSDEDFAMVTLMKHLYEYPDSAVKVGVKSHLDTLINSEVSKKLRPTMQEIAKGYPSSSKAMRLAVFLQKMSAGEVGKDYFEPVVAEYHDFFIRFQDYPKMDVLMMTLSDLYVRKGYPLSAVLTYDKLLAMYPGTEYKPRVTMMMADVLAEKLDQYDKAIEVYQTVTSKFPGTPEAANSYTQIIRLAEYRKKYLMAVEVCGEVIKIYAGQDAAHSAFLTKARLLRERLKQPKDAVATLEQLANMFKGDRAVEALNLAAEIAARDMKDYTLQIALYDRIVKDYADTPAAPKALYEKGMVYEKQLKKPDQALQVYQQIVDRYPGNSMKAAAEKRIAAINKDNGVGENRPVAKKEEPKVEAKAAIPTQTDVKKPESTDPPEE